MRTLLEKRYMYYVMFSMIMMGADVFTANLLASYSYKGAIAGMVAAAILAFILCYSLLKSLDKFPQKNLAEILRESRIPSFLRILFLMFFFLVWIALGWFLQGQSVIAYKFYFLPNFHHSTIWVAHAVVAAILSRLDSKSILFLCEIFFLFLLGIEVITIWMFSTYEFFSWQDILLALTYATTKPAFTTITLSSIVFAGLSTMATFNKVIAQEDKKIKAAVYIAAFGLFMLLSRQMLVIGASGMDAAAKYSMSGFSAADSIRVEVFITERVIYFFLISITTMLLVGNILLWHSAIAMIRSTFNISPRTEWVVMSLISLVPIILQKWFLEPSFQAAIRSFAWIHLASNFIFVVLLLYCAKRKVQTTNEF